MKLLTVAACQSPGANLLEWKTEKVAKRSAKKGRRIQAPGGRMVGSTAGEQARVNKCSQTNAVCTGLFKGLPSNSLVSYIAERAC